MNSCNMLPCPAIRSRTYLMINRLVELILRVSWRLHFYKDVSKVEANHVAIFRFLPGDLPSGILCREEYRAEMGRGGKLEEPTGVRMSAGAGSPSRYKVVRASCELTRSPVSVLPVP